MSPLARFATSRRKVSDMLRRPKCYKRQNTTNEGCEHWGFQNPMRKLSEGNCVGFCGKADPAQQILEAWIVAQIIHAWIDVKINKPVGVVFVGFLEVLNRLVVFSQAHMDSSEEMRR